jgi:hypothetical protein
VDLKDSFAPGQVYVALSRATQPAGLSVLNFLGTELFADDKVRQFYTKTFPGDCFLASAADQNAQ